MAKDAANKGRTPFIPSKSGDGAAISSAGKKPASRKKRRTLHDLDNTRVCLTGADESRCKETMDPFDRAHDARDPRGNLKPAAILTGQGGARVSVKHSTPRRYPKDLCAIVTIAGKPTRIGIDSVFDSTFLLTEQLARDGLDVGAGINPVHAALALAERILDDEQLRSTIRPETHQRMTARELELHREGTRLLKQARGGAS